MLVDPADINPSILEGAEASGAGYSNLQIWLETYGIWIAFAVMVIVVVAAVLFTGRRKITGRRKNKRRRKRR